VIVSGGLDSTILVYDMVSRGYTPHMLSFNYGQRHKKELTFAAHTAVKLGLRHDIVDLSGITELISNSALTANNTRTYGGGYEEIVQPAIEVPEGHYAEESMKATVVPNRNMIMLSIAAGVAVNNKYRCIGTGVHGGDHFIYPDCRPDFIWTAAAAIERGNDGFHAFELSPRQTAIFAPYLHGSKADIALRGLELSVPFEETWSCYKGGDKHCGKCGTCVERLEAIAEAENKWISQYHGAFQHDLTEYEDREFWKQAIKEKS
jgi:7-cyano-7-deazaguanine synthase